MSPFLFILCTEVLSRLLNREVERNNLKGISIKRGCPGVTHLLFADDLIVFGEASVEEATSIMGCLETYGAW